MVAEMVLDKEEVQSMSQEGQESSLQQIAPLKEGKRVLQDILDSYGGTTDHPLAARFFDEFSGKQQKLSAFFKKPASSTTGSLTAATKPTTTTTASVSSFLDNKRPSGSQTDEDDSNAPRKKPFFASLSTTPTLPSTPPSPGPGSQTRTSTPDSIPKPIIKSTAKPGSAATTKKSSTTSAKPSGQQTMLSFFGAPAKKPAKDATPNSGKLSEQPQPDSRNVNSASQQSVPSPTAISASLESSIGSSQESLSLPTSTTTAVPSSSSSSSTFSPQDYADWIPGSQDVLPFSINGETTTTKWQSLFTPKTIPKCKFHNQPCTEYTVNKKGPNKGRRFFLCSL